MATQKQMDEAIRLIMYRIYPPDGVWFETSTREDLEEILWKLVEYTTPYDKNKFTP